MFLVVGLGNPDKKYQLTYHNIGFMVVDRLCARGGFKFDKTKCKSHVCQFYLNDNKVLVAKPITYMNLSGSAVASLKNKFRIPNDKIIVISDDIDLPLGKWRFKESGSGGTHNGLRNIVSIVGQDFARIRIGVGKPDNGISLADFVLSEIKPDVLAQLEPVFDEVIERILDFCEK